MRDLPAEITEVRLVGNAMPGEVEGRGRVGVELELRVTGVAELHRAVGARVVGVVLGPQLR
jgi:hypothetical protein